MASHDGKQNGSFALLTVAAVVLLGFMGYLAIQNYRLASKPKSIITNENLSETEAPSFGSVTKKLSPTKKINPETANWQVFTAEDNLFTFRYPNDVVLSPPTEIITQYPLYVTVKDLDNYIDDQAGFDKTTALQDRESLKKNEFGAPMASTEKGRTIVPLGDYNGKMYTVLRYQYVCDIQFSRSFIVYKENKQITIKLVVPNKLTEAKKLTTYFTPDSPNCASAPEWKNEDLFMTDLLAKNVPATFLTWYSLFEKIVDSIEL